MGQQSDNATVTRTGQSDRRRELLPSMCALYWETRTDNRQEGFKPVIREKNIQQKMFHLDFGKILTNCRLFDKLFLMFVFFLIILTGL